MNPEHKFPAKAWFAIIGLAFVIGLLGLWATWGDSPSHDVSSHDTTQLRQTLCSSGAADRIEYADVMADSGYRVGCTVEVHDDGSIVARADAFADIVAFGQALDWTEADIERVSSITALQGEISLGDGSVAVFHPQSGLTVTRPPKEES